jgi:hypothetical protein
MKTNRVHYTWQATPKSIDKTKPVQKSSLLGLIAILALLSKLKLGGGD